MNSKECVGTSGAKRTSYFDNAATCPIRPQALEVMNDVLLHCDGNPSSPHSIGRQAKEVLEESRQMLADCLGVDAEEVYFTSGATESNNLAIRGVCAARASHPGAIITSALEHASVTKSIRGMKREGWDVEYIEAPGGLLNLDQLERALAKPVTLVSVMSVQNEVGYRFPVDQVARMAREMADGALVHTDGVQAFGKIPLRPRRLDVDLLTVSSHKIGGPKGVGALYVRNGVNLFSNALGGGQERGLRSGTEAVYAIAGFAKAAQLAIQEQAAAYQHAKSLKTQLCGMLLEKVPSAIVNSREDGSPFMVSVTIPGMSNKRAVDYLSQRGIYVSKASACSENHTTVPEGTWRPKHPQSLSAAGIPQAHINSTLRISFSLQNTVGDIGELVNALCAFLAAE